MTFTNLCDDIGDCLGNHTTT